MKVADARLPFFLIIVVLFPGLIWLAWPRPAALDMVMPDIPVPPAIPGHALQAIVPLAPIPGLNPARVALGELLFRDKRLSADQSIACISCHDLARGGADGRRFSVGIGGALGEINAPTVFNSAYSIAQFWDGRAANLEEQAAGPIHNPKEMGSNWAEVMARLGADQRLRREFVRAYPDGLTADNVANAIASFERSLVTLDSRYDRYLGGEAQFLTPLELEGARRFSELGCSSCHQGALLGGNMFQKFGVLKDYFAGRVPSRSDLGRYNLTQREEDRHVFKVPSLRNVALTAPYFHDGSVDSLDQAVIIMGRYQLGIELLPQDVAALVAFLHSLTGVWPPAVRP